MNPEHFADTRWEDVLERQSEQVSADEYWTTEALCDCYNG